MFKAVLFDMDGVITDNREQDFRAWQKIFSNFDKDLDYAGYQSFLGMKGEEIVRSRINPEMSEEQASMWTKKKEAYFIKEIKDNKIETMQGLLNFLNNLKENDIKIGLGTAAMEFKALAILNELEIRDFFDVIICGEKVINGKPDPETYLKGAEELGLQPDECIVIEDAPNGIEAAKRAGMKCIAITSTHGREDLNEADMIIDSFDELNLASLIICSDFQENAER